MIIIYTNNIEVIKRRFEMIIKYRYLVVRVPCQYSNYICDIVHEATEPPHAKQIMKEFQDSMPDTAFKIIKKKSLIIG
jgi:hypothetical protein